MDRRDSIKSIMLGSIGFGVLFEGCVTGVSSEDVKKTISKFQYGRTDKELAYDKKLFSIQCFSKKEMKSITQLCNLILPPNEFGSIEDAEVPELIEFMAKDIPGYEIPIKDGLLMLDKISKQKNSMVFINCNEIEQKKILDQMAFPDPDMSSSEQKEEVKWFSLMRNLTMTGYYTSKVGIEELGYVGNTPNVWDGVPQDVLDQYGLSYDQDWINKCIDQSKRNETAVWDDQGNLIS
tara:strand:+ start:2019 stop:2726 length:708 start_codon:yes stop_codon:yes gene_type:complete